MNFSSAFWLPFCRIVTNPQPPSPCFNLSWARAQPLRSDELHHRKCVPFNHIQENLISVIRNAFLYFFHEDGERKRRFDCDAPRGEMDDLKRMFNHFQQKIRFTHSVSICAFVGIVVGTTRCDMVANYVPSDYVTLMLTYSIPIAVCCVLCAKQMPTGWQNDKFDNLPIDMEIKDEWAIYFFECVGLCALAKERAHLLFAVGLVSQMLM